MAEGGATPVVPDDTETLQREVRRLNKVVAALMNRAERDMSARTSDFALFQTTVSLEAEIRRRTQELEAALHENEKVNRALAREKEEQRELIKKLEEAHNQLLQSEKLASIGQLAAGVAHEINNPIGFVNSNLGTLKAYVGSILDLVDGINGAVNPLLAAHADLRAELEKLRKAADFDYVRDDIGNLISESIDGTARVRKIVQDLRDFSRTGEVEMEWVDLHAGLDSTLNVVWNEIKYKAEVDKCYGQLPLVECRPSQINQVFMNLLVNAAQAIPERGRITISTGAQDGQVWVSIRDTGAGIPAAIRDRIFDPFFTTKPVGKGTGLGLSVSYGIIEKHGGRIDLDTTPGEGTTFTVRLPVSQAH